MKQIGWLGLLILLLAACQGEPKETNDAESPATEAPAQDARDAALAQGGSAAAPTNPGNSPLVQSLTNNYWVVEHWVNPDNDRQVYLANKGRWWNLHPDGTFETGIWQEQKSRGSWRMYMEKGDPYVIFDAENDAHDGEWKIQINASGTEASWVGSSTYTSSRGIMSKLDNLLTMPTKEQYGLQ